MSTAINIDFYEIQQIRCRTANPSRFEEIAERIRKAARTVKREWNNFSAEDREKLKHLAYDLIERPKRVPSLWRNLWVKAYSWFIVLTNQAEAFCSCIEAIDMLVDNILDAVEREEVSYQAVLSDTLEQLYSNTEQGQALKPEATREWLRKLSDKAIGEV